jgi:hypothetical protein
MRREVARRIQQKLVVENMISHPCLSLGRMIASAE